MAIAGGPLNAGIVSPAQHQHAYDEHQQREEEEQFLPVDRLADGRACERADDAAPRIEKAAAPFDRPGADRKSVVSGKSVSVRVDLGGRRIIKKKKTKYASTQSVNENKTEHID